MVDYPSWQALAGNSDTILGMKTAVYKLDAKSPLISRLTVNKGVIPKWR